MVKPLSSSPSICVFFCIVIYKLKQAGPLKSGKSQLAGIHQRYVFNQEFMFDLVLGFELTLNIEPSEQLTRK
jgi:hypothetical protein